MTLVMFSLAFILSYCLFIGFAYTLARMIFTNIDKAEEQQQKEKLLQMMKAKRVKRAQRLMHSKMNLVFKN